MTLQEQTFELLQSTGLNWSVQKEALVSANGGKGTESFGMFRKDNGKWMGTVGNNYQAFQNSELAETIIEATQGVGLVTTRGGELCEGRKVYLQAELPSEFIGQSNVLRWITALNSHDGSTSIGFGSSSTVVVCQNTFYRAYSGLTKFRHTISAKERIAKTISDLREALKLDTKLMESFKHMADSPLKEEIFANIITACFDASLDSKESEISTRKKNQLIKVSESIQKEIKLEGATLWGLFNGITRYTNHVATTPENKDEYIMAGGGYRTNLVAFDTIMKWMEKHSAKPVMSLS